MFLPSLLAVGFLHTVPTDFPTKSANGVNAEQAARKELQQLQGTWNTVSISRDGNPLPPKELHGRVLFFGGEIFLDRHGEQILAAGTARIDPTRSVKTITKSLGKDGDGPEYLGIYELKGDTLTVCFDPSGKKRPREFKSEPGSGIVLAVYQRPKPPADEARSIIGVYECETLETDGTVHSSQAEIVRQGDAYQLRYMKNKKLQFVGVGIRKGDILAVTWANRGGVGLSIYKIDAVGRLIGDYTQLGGVGTINRETLTPAQDD